MKSFLDTKFSFFKSHFEFISPLSLTTCENRLEDLGASIYEAKPTGNPLRRKSSTFYLDHPKNSFFRQIELIGELQEIENGTLITTEYSAPRVYFNYIGFVILFLYSLYSKTYALTLFAVTWALTNTLFIQSYRSSWEYLKSKVEKSLKHWKKE